MSDDNPQSADRHLRDRIKTLEDEMWVLTQEFEGYVSAHNGDPFERLIEASAPRHHIDEHLNRYKFAQNYVEGKRVLDMACGSGFGSNCLSKNAKVQSVLGVDIDPIAIRYAQLKFGSVMVSFTLQDACSEWTEEKFGAVVSFETIEHVPEPELLLKQIVRMIERDGVLLVSTPVRKTGSLEDKPKNPFHIREWNQLEFEEMLRKFFGEVEFFGQTHPFMSKIGPLPLPHRLLKAFVNATGSYDELLANYSRVAPFHLKPNRWLETIPNYMLCVCKKPLK